MSQPPEYPGSPSDPQGYPPSAPRHGAPPPPPPGYGAPPPPPSYSPPPTPDYGGGPPGGGYSAPGGGYSAPSYGGPPPPPPGYGAPSAPPSGYPPPPPGFGGMQGGAEFSVGDAFSWSWAKFTQNWAALIVPLLLYVVALGVVVGIPFGIAFGTAETTTTTYDNGYGTYYSTETSADPTALGWMLITLGSILAMMVVIYMQAALISGCLDIADGKPVSIGTFFKPRNVGRVLLTSLLIAVAAWVTACTFVGPIIIAFFALFAPAFAVDRSMSPIDAIKASFGTVKNNLGPTFLSYLVQQAVIFVGYIACVVGMIAAVPVSQLILVYTYRKLSGGQVVDAQPSGMPPSMPPGPYPGPQYA